MDIEQDLKNPVGMALKAGVSGSHVQQQVHMISGIVSTRKGPTSSLCVFLKKRWILMKHHLNHTVLMGKATHPALFQKQE